MSEDKLIRIDRLRYIKNTTSSRLALLAIVFNVLFFVSIYQSDVGYYYYTIQIGASVLYNLIFMLMAFLASEGVKNYKPAFSWLLLGLGVGQIIRIFILPMQAHAAEIKVKKDMVAVMGDGQFNWCVICLALSAVCCVVSAIVNLQKARSLARHNAVLEGQKA